MDKPLTKKYIDNLIARRNVLTSRRDGWINWEAVNRIDAKLQTVEAGKRNDVDVALGRPGAVLPERVEYGPQDAPSDYRIANRPDNPNWHGVAAWFDEAARLRPSTDTAAATEAVAELAQAKQDAFIACLINVYDEWLDYERIKRDLAI